MDSCVTAAIAHQEHRLALVHASYGQRTERRERRRLSRSPIFMEFGSGWLRALSILRKLEARADRLAYPGARKRGSRSGRRPKVHSGNLRALSQRTLSFRSSELGGSDRRAQCVHRRGRRRQFGLSRLSPEYYRVFAQLVRAGTRPETQIGIVTPVIELRKGEIVRRGIELGAPLHLTWSCYQFEDAACGVCDSVGCGCVRSPRPASPTPFPIGPLWLDFAW